MNTDNIAIRVSNLSKCYQIYDTPRDRLKQFVVPTLCHVFPPLRKFFAGINHQPSTINHQPSTALPRFYKEFWALKDVSFEIKKGETVGIIGRNGSGKSTLLQMICGTLTPTSGSIQTNGRIAALLELGSGFNPEFTGRENVYMNAAVLGLTHAEIDTRFDEIAAFADIGEFIEQPVKTYSSGMFVRLAFAVSIMSTPEIMIVDEALAVGDMAFQAKCMTALHRLQAGGTTVLFVSHDISSLKSLCTRGIYLEHGELKEIGSAGDVAEHYVRAMRIEMNEEYVTTMPKESLALKQEAANAVVSQRAEGSQKLNAITDFEKRVAQFRYGDGGIKITNVELFDENFQPINNVEFNQTVFISIYFESSIDDEIGCNYYVMDNKRNLILGASLNLIDLKKPVMSVKRGGEYKVTYKTRLPLHEGDHSIQLQIVKATSIENTAIFLDVVDDALVFKMSRRDGARIWTRAFVENEVEIKSC